LHHVSLFHITKANQMSFAAQGVQAVAYQYAAARYAAQLQQQAYAARLSTCYPPPAPIIRHGQGQGFGAPQQQQPGAPVGEGEGEGEGIRRGAARPAPIPRFAARRRTRAGPVSAPAPSVSTFEITGRDLTRCNYFSNLLFNYNERIDLLRRLSGVDGGGHSSFVIFFVWRSWPPRP